MEAYDRGGLEGLTFFTDTLRMRHWKRRDVRSVLEQLTATERSDELWAYCISTGQLRESKGGDVMRAGAK